MIKQKFAFFANLLKQKRKQSVSFPINKIQDYFFPVRETAKELF